MRKGMINVKKENPVGKPGDSLIYGLLYCIYTYKKIMPDSSPVKT